MENFPKRLLNLLLKVPMTLVKRQGFLFFKVSSQCQELLVLQGKNTFQHNLLNLAHRLCSLTNGPRTLCVWKMQRKYFREAFRSCPKRTKRQANKSGFYITTNEMPRFGGVDDEARRRRLAVFQTDPLPTVKRSTTKWLRRNCMQVVHYYNEELKDQASSQTMMKMRTWS